MRVVLIGYGKMGKEIEQILIEQKHQIIAIVDTYNSNKLPKYLTKNIDVAIEFTEPKNAIENYLLCFKNNVPVVSGTTGWLKHKKEVLEQLNLSNGAFFYSPNFSIGVHVFFKVNKYLAKLMNKQKPYTVQIEETHHTEKIDKPSGTAIKTAEIIIDELDRKTNWSLDSIDKSKNVSINAQRIENIPGTHKTIYQSPEDEISISHKAFSRKGFAKGAVQAAQWIIGKKGYFTMDDMINDSE